MWAIVITRRLSVSLLTIVQNDSLLPHAFMDLFKTWTQCSLGNGQYRVLRKLWSKVPYGPYGPFYQILQNASSPTDSVVLCWWFVTMILWWWFFQGVQEFVVQGPMWALWPFLWNSAKSPPPTNCRVQLWWLDVMTLSCWYLHCVQKVWVQGPWCGHGVHFIK